MPRKKYTSKSGKVYDIHYGEYTGATVSHDGKTMPYGFENPSEAVRFIEQQKSTNNKVTGYGIQENRQVH